MSKPRRSAWLFMFSACLKSTLLTYRFSQRTWKANHKLDELEYLKRLPRIKRFRILSERKVASARSVVKVEFLRKSTWYECELQVIGEKEPYTPTARGRWGINPISFLKVSPLR